jgi:hypothetical protein
VRLLRDAVRMFIALLRISRRHHSLQPTVQGSRPVP